MNKYKDTVFQDFFTGLTPAKKEVFAKRMGTSVNSIRANWLRPTAKMRRTHKTQLKSTVSQPSSKTMLSIVRASRKAFSYEDMLDHFYRI